MISMAGRTLSADTGNAIRPLGEEHLRMFRRTTARQEEVSKINMPREAKVQVSLSKDAEIYRFVRNSATIEGGRFATLPEIIFDTPLLESIRKSTHAMVFISWRDVPEKAGWYQTDRKAHSLIQISEERAEGLDHAEKLCITVAIGSVESKRALAFGFRPDGLRWVSEVPDRDIIAHAAIVRDETT